MRPLVGRNGRSYTISIAVAGSIIDNAQSLELATALAGQIGRAAAVFQIDEVVVFGEEEDAMGPGKQRRWRSTGAGSAGDEEGQTGGAFLARVLQYLEVPQYLRRALIPMHPDLRYAGLLPPLDAPHHSRGHEWVPYREGCALSEAQAADPERGGKIEMKKGKRKKGKGGGTFVDVGLRQPVKIADDVPAGVRVTVAMGDDRDAAMRPDAILQAVSPSEPREKRGLYWGYSLRLVNGLSRVFAECPYQGGYDWTIGTSEHGLKVRSSDLKIPSFRHLLIVFGGLAGLEESTELDNSIQVKDTSCLFDCYLNTCPTQGSRTIRTEEAVFISLGYMQEAIWRATGQNPCSDS
eukprot:TRINITY_DN965_c0_g1_i3.p1 TRINITY_DN965_c0_g1~~TRINITY_DN965_c0_g1_i3.p1  ORF type:complete len:350 (+),score=63.33 TRINITY_DN965_c0_g1_i3:205-1254(+)